MKDYNPPSKTKGQAKTRKKIKHQLNKKTHMVSKQAPYDDSKNGRPKRGLAYELW